MEKYLQFNVEYFDQLWPVFILFLQFIQIEIFLNILNIEHISYKFIIVEEFFLSHVFDV